MTPRYELCGWQVESELPLPELPLVEEALSPRPDLTIRFGEVPESLPDLSFSGPLLQVGSDGTSRLALPGGLTFLVDRAGQQITIATKLPAGSPAIRAFLLGNVLGLVCLRRGGLPLHACCIALPTPEGEVAVAFTAPSGSGKSTLASAFVAHGCRLLADDLAVVSAGAAGVQVLPTFPRLRLWRDTMDIFGHSVEGSERVRDEMEKYSVPMGRAFARKPLPLAALYHYARVEDDRHAELRRARGIDATARFLDAIYQRRALLCAAAADQATPMALITRTVGAIPEHWVLAQPNGIARLEQLVERLIGKYGVAAEG